MSSKKRRQPNQARKKEIPELLSRLRRANPNHFDWVLDAFFIDEVFGAGDLDYEHANIAAAGAALLTPLDQFDNGVTIAEHVGALIAHSFHHPDQPATSIGRTPLDVVRQLCTQAADTAGPLSGVWACFSTLAEAVQHHLADPDSRDTQLSSDPLVNTTRALLVALNGDFTHAEPLCRDHLDDIAAVCSGPLGTIFCASLIPVVARINSCTADNIIAASTEPFIGSSEALQPVIAGLLHEPGNHHLFDTVVAAFQRWAAWGAQVRRAALLPDTHPDTFNTKRWERHADVTRAGAALYHYLGGQHDLFHRQLDGWDHPYADYFELAAEFDSILNCIALPADPTERADLFTRLRAARGRIEKLQRRFPNCSPSQRDIGRLLSLRVAAAVADNESLSEIANLISGDDVELDHNTGWWLVQAAINEQRADYTVGMLCSTAAARDPRSTPHDLLDKIARTTGTKPDKLRNNLQPALQQLHDANTDANAVVAAAHQIVDDLVDDDRVADLFVTPLLRVTVDPPHEPPHLGLDDVNKYGIHRAQNLIGAAIVVAEASELVAGHLTPTPVEQQPVTIDDDSDDEDIEAREERRRRREERRAARRRRPDHDISDPTSGSDDDTPDTIEAVETGIVDAVNHLDRRRAAQICERLEALHASGADVTDIAASWVDHLTSGPLRGVLGDTDCDLELVRALQLAGRQRAASGVAVGLFWRTYNAGGDPGDFYELAVELDADPDTLRTMADTLHTVDADIDADAELVAGHQLRIVFVGGREEQARVTPQIDSDLTQRYNGAVTVHWIHPGWTKNTGAEAAKVAGALNDADALVLMRFIPTVLGEQLRRLADVAEVPWVPCTGHGRTSMTRAIDTAVAVAVGLHDADASSDDRSQAS